MTAHHEQPPQKQVVERLFHGLLILDANAHAELVSKGERLSSCRFVMRKAVQCPENRSMCLMHQGLKISIVITSPM